MKLAIPKGNGGVYTFTNEGLKVGDKVFPLVDGWSHKGEWYVTGLSFKHDLDHDAFSIFACTGWRRTENKRKPHTIKRFDHPAGEPERIYTDKGYGPAQCYFKYLGIAEMPGLRRAGACKECGFDSECKIKQNRKDGCSFYKQKDKKQNG